MVMNATFGEQLAANLERNATIVIYQTTKVLTWNLGTKWNDADAIIGENIAANATAIEPWASKKKKKRK